MAWYRLPQYSGPRLGAAAALLAALGAAGLSATNLLQRLFRDDMAALQRLNTLYFTVGYCGYLATWILDLIVILLHPPRLQQAVQAAKALLLALSPHYCFVSGAAAVATTAPTAGDAPPLPPPFGPGAQRGAFDWEVSGLPMACLAAQCVAYTALGLLLDSGLLEMCSAVLFHTLSAAWAARQAGAGTQRQPGGTRDEEEGLGAALLPRDGVDTSMSGAGDEDADVAMEREAVWRGQRDGSPLLLKGLKKTYWPAGPFAPPVRALKGVSVGIRAGECFGLLGVNGAGKTTAFRLVTGEIMPDAWEGGDALVARTSVVTARLAAQRLLGYCPQFDGLPVALTGAELLRLYARLRGVPWRTASVTAQALLARVGLPLRDWHRPIGTYSGGNKRKLAVTVALVGEPQVVLLDEPSTGMDPGARMQLWALIGTHVLPSAASSGMASMQTVRVPQPGGTANAEPHSGHAHAVSETSTPASSVVLSSHSMAECEALCSRIGILAGGRLKCLGTPQQLVARYDSGYILTIRLAAGDHVPQAQLTSVNGAADPSLVTLSAPMEGLVARLQHVCKAIQVLEADWPQLVLGIPREYADMAALFEVLEGCRGQEMVVGVDGDVLGDPRAALVSAYSLTQAASLERVFVAIAAGQSRD